MGPPPPTAAEPADRWNHNLHHHPVLLDAVPERCRLALDVGCGDGVLTRQLATCVGPAGRVVGLDRDGPTLERARATLAPGVDWVLGDVLHAPFAPDRFDFVASVAALHHVDTVAGLSAMAALLRPGGTLAIVGLARSRYPRDLPRDATAAVVSRWYRLRRTHWVHQAPIVWPPPDTYDELAAITARVLPGATFRRHLLWRCSITWRRPA
jgi:SAM-dependent methyltransferase